jgi:hypothetical protein
VSDTISSAASWRADVSYIRDIDRMALGCSVASLTLGIAGLGAFIANVDELGFILLGLAVIFWFGWWVLSRRLYGNALLVLMFLAGYALSWCIGFLGYRYIIFDRADVLGLPIKHTATTAVLVLTSIIATVSGAMSILYFCRRSTNGHLIADHRSDLLRALFVFAGIFFVFQAISLQVMGLNARFEIGNYHQVGSRDYIVAGFSMVAYPFYALLGMSLKAKLTSGWNIAVAATVIVIVGFLSLTGGRSTALEPLVVLFIGASFSVVPWRRISFFCAASLPLVAFIMIVIGVARGTGAFSGGNVTEKVTAITKIVKEGRNEGDQYDSPLFVLFSRLYEPSAQAVIDNVAETGHRIGFLNTERLLFVFVPQFVYPKKKPLDDGNERLTSDYGYAVTEFSSTPLTLLADSYERFGIAGVAVFHLLAGALLCIVGNLIFRVRERILALILLICCARATLLTYPFSTLGFFHFLFYGLARDILAISFLYYGGVLVVNSLSRRSNAVQPMPTT